MAKCLGGTCPYGWGHPREHAEAARKGWRRRHGTEAEHLGSAFGGGYELHRHKDKVIMQGKDGGDYFELSAREARDIIKHEREKATQAREAQRHAERAEKERRRNQYQQTQLSQKITKAGDRSAARYHRQEAQYERLVARDRERAERQRAREDEASARMSAKFEREMLYSAVKDVSRSGIRAYTGKALNEDIYANIPKSLRSRQGMAPDEMAASLSEMFPYLNIHSDSDLSQAFVRTQLARTNEIHRRRHARAA